MSLLLTTLRENAFSAFLSILLVSSRPVRRFYAFFLLIFSFFPPLPHDCFDVHEDINRSTASVFVPIIGFLTLFERKILSYIQNRRGPNKLLFKGSSQPFSDILKLIFKKIFYLRINILL